MKKLFNTYTKQEILSEDGFQVFDNDSIREQVLQYPTNLEEIAKHLTNKRWRRAISLDGLEDNNGWIEFNSEVKIEPTTNYWVRTSNDVIQLLQGSIINSIKTKNLIQITHIIPIVEPKHPLYVEE